MVGKEAAGCTPGEAPERVDPPTSVSGCVVEVMMVVMAWRGSSRAVSRSFIEGWVMRVPGDGERRKLRERKRQCKDEGRGGEGEKKLIRTHLILQTVAQHRVTQALLSLLAESTRCVGNEILSHYQQDYHHEGLG